MKLLSENIIPYFVEDATDNSNIKLSKVKPSEKHGERKDKLKLTFFKANLNQAVSAYVSQNDRYFLLAGDAFRFPNYQTADGFNHALEHAKTLGKLFAKQISADDYAKACKELGISASELSGTFYTDKKAAIKIFEEAVESAKQILRNKKNLA